MFINNQAKQHCIVINYLKNCHSFPLSGDELQASYPDGAVIESSAIYGLLVLRAGSTN